MKHKSSILLSLFLLLFIPTLVYAAVPPSAYFYVLYEGNKITDTELSGEFLSCEDENYNPEREIISQLNISQYDSTNNCYWKPFKHSRGGYCETSTCDFFPIPSGKTRFAIYISSFDQFFITNEIQANIDKNYYKVELFSNGSAFISTTSREDVDAFSNKNTPEIPTLQNKFLYSIILLSFIALIYWIVRRKSKQ